MKVKELKLASNLLMLLDEILSNRVCNDYSFPSDWTEEEEEQFVKDFHDFNGDPEEFEQGNKSIHDFCVAYTLAKKLDEYTDSLISQSCP